MSAPGLSPAAIVALAAGWLSSSDERAAALSCLVLALSPYVLSGCDISGTLTVRKVPSVALELGKTHRWPKMWLGKKP